VASPKEFWGVAKITQADPTCHPKGRIALFPLGGVGAKPTRPYPTRRLTYMILTHVAGAQNKTLPGPVAVVRSQAGRSR